MSEKTDYLLSTKAVRERSKVLFELNLEGQGHFDYFPEKWDDLVEFVYQTILEKYPDLDIPFHSRLGHFRPGGIDRLEWLDQEGLSSMDRARLLSDLVIPSVLLDAGAGDKWSFKEERTSLVVGRSEGLGVASFWMFADGLFDHNGGQQTTKKGLQSLDLKTCEKSFQVNEENPIVGMEGRLGLLHRLGEVIQERPSEIIDDFFSGDKVDALKVLDTVLKKFGPIWPSRYSLDGISLGDTWSHPKLGEEGSFESFVPFHKLSQWMSYSLLDVMKYCGFDLINVDQLTGLPEYRNGGLLLDLGLIAPKNEEDLSRGVSVDGPLVIEWRAMTVVILDELAQKLRDRMEVSRDEFPLAKVLEGGTWWAGRKAAALQREGGGSPINIISDGTVF